MMQRVACSCLFAGVLVTILLASHTGSPSSSLPGRFRDIASESALTTIPQFSREKIYIAENTGGGIGLLDCDNDGRLDLIVTRDSTVDQYASGGAPMVIFYRQVSYLRFSDQTEAAGLKTRGWGMGVAVGDFDNDSWLDIYVVGLGHNVLYRNLGGCQFEDVTERARVAGGGFSIAAAWADYDRDSHLDLFVSRYIPYDIRNLPRPGSRFFDYKGLAMEVPDMIGETHFLFRNLGNGTFEEVGGRAGVGNPFKRRGMGVVWGDYDNDGWPDLYVTIDVGPNFLYRNRRDGKFEDVGVISGTALGMNGEEFGDMTGDFGDIDRDGKLDLVVTRFGNQPASLYWNRGEEGFMDIAATAGLSGPTYSPVQWGTGFLDFDNDGWLDIFIANGNVSPLVDQLPDETPYRQPIQLFHNRRDRTFEEVASLTGLNDGPLQSRRGTAFGDVNNDGRVDVAAYNLGGPPSLFINETQNSNRRALFRLVGSRSNRAAIGARVTVHTSKLVLIDEVRGGGSYASSNDQRLHFGLGSEAIMDRVEIQWPSGLREVLRSIPADAVYEIVEGKGITKTIKLAPPSPEPSARAHPSRRAARDAR